MQTSPLPPALDLPGLATKPIDLVGILRRRLVLVVACGLALFVCLLPLALLLSSTYYTATGIMQVTRVQPSILNESEVYSIGSYYGSYVQTQLVLFSKDQVLQSAIDKLPPSLKGRFTVESLKKKLTLEPISGTELFEVQLTDRRPEGLAVMLNAIIDAYLVEAEQDQEFNNNRRLSYLKAEKEGLEKTLGEEQGQLNELSERLQGSSFDEQYNPYRQASRFTQEALIKAKAERLQKEHALREIIQRNEKLRRLPMDSIADQVAYTDQSLWGIQVWTYETLQGMRATIDGVAPGNPDRKYVEDRMKGMQEFEANHRKEVLERTKKTVVEKRDRDLEQDRINAEHDYQAAAETEKKLQEEDSRVVDLAAKQSADLLRGAALKVRVENLQRRISQVESRMSDLSLEAKQPLRVFPSERAESPKKPAKNNLPKLLVLLVVFAMGLSAGLFGLYDLADPRIRRAQDVEFAIGSLPHRPVPYVVCGQPGAPSSFDRLMLEAPDSNAALSVRSLAGRLHMEHESQGTRLVLGTGIDGCNGVTTLLLNAAQSMTGLCQRVLLVDLNCRGDRTLRHRLGLADDPRSLAGEASASGSGIIHDEERGIDLLLASPGERFRMEDLLRVLGDLQKRYDLVLVDAPPLLHSAETECLVKIAPLTLLVIEADYSIYADIRRAIALLFRFNAPAVMAVLNWGGHGPGWSFRIPLFPPWPLVKRSQPKPRPSWFIVLVNGFLIRALNELERRCQEWQRKREKPAA